MGKKCSLCGGKLDGRNICKECGLDNSKSDSNYRVRYQKPYQVEERPIKEIQERQKGRKNRADTEDAPAWRAGERVDTSVYPTGNIGKPRKKKKVGRIVAGILIAIVIWAVIIICLVLEEVEREEKQKESYTYYDPYEWVAEELPEEGEEEEYTLLQGSYVVGVHIPAGNYEAETEQDYDWVKVTDWENGIFLFEYEEKSGGNYLDDLRLFNGALVEIGEYGPVRLRTSNAQVSDMQGIANPLTEGCEITGGVELRAGKDFPAGVYDAELDKGNGMVELTVYYEDEEQDTKRYSFDSEEGRFCKNIVIPEGAKLVCDEGMQLRLTPSEQIETVDYLEYYKMHEGRFEEYGE